MTSYADSNQTSRVTMDQLYREGKQERDVFIEACEWKGGECEEGDFQETLTDLGVCHTFEREDMDVGSSGEIPLPDFLSNISSITCPFTNFANHFICLYSYSNESDSTEPAINKYFSRVKCRLLLSLVLRHERDSVWRVLRQKQ